MRFVDLKWTDDSIEHIARHGVEPDEVEDIAFGASTVTRARENVYRLIGKTMGGRFLTVFLASRGRGVFVIVTARDATMRERQTFRAR